MNTPLPSLEQHLADRLTAYQERLVRERIYFARYPGDTPVKPDRCRHAVTQSRQCDGLAKVRRGEHWVCKKHSTVGGMPFPRGR